MRCSTEKQLSGQDNCRFSVALYRYDVVDFASYAELMLEKVGLHLWEMLELSTTVDKLAKLRRWVADFNVKAGTNHVDALAFDTAATTVFGSGGMVLSQATLYLTLSPKSRKISFVAQSSPIYVRGGLARPTVEVDTRRAATRAFGAIALALINPLLALIPLIDPGPGKDSDCGQLIRDGAFERLQSK